MFTRTAKPGPHASTFFLCLAWSTPQATLLNSYLVQLLDNGFLHADPHPGNFLLQDDGTLCVLDFGLMTEVPFFCLRHGPLEMIRGGVSISVLFVFLLLQSRQLRC